jgi:glycosyltransferase involved in cell wall biosynthesis
MRVIVTHDFFETFGGAERVTAEIAAAFPNATVHAILGRRSVAERMGVEDRVFTILPERERLLAGYRMLAPAYPALVRAARLPEADVVIASSYAYAHAFETPNRAPKLCYCHGPFRHLWSQQKAYTAAIPGGRPAQWAFGLYSELARAADRSAARSVAAFLTQSPFTANLIGHAYGRHSGLLPPPIDCDLFRPAQGPPQGYFLFVGRLVEPYKRPSLVIDAFARMPEQRLLVAGDGPELKELRRRATPNVSFLGTLDDAGLVDAMQHCEAALFPSVDDFGLVPLEVNACGRPVLAYRGGGSLYTIRAGVTGAYFHEQTADAVVKAVRGFDPAAYDPAEIRRHALCWDRTEFRKAIRRAAEDLVGAPPSRPLPGRPRITQPVVSRSTASG